MGDIGDYWREHKEYARKQKAKQRSRIPQYKQDLEKAGFNFIELSIEHCRVEGAYDWWPSTGYWKSLSNEESGHGVYKLIKQLKKDRANEAA